VITGAPLDMLEAVMQTAANSLEFLLEILWRSLKTVRYCP
jgi:hypothetical protein